MFWLLLWKWRFVEKKKKTDWLLSSVINGKSCVKISENYKSEKIRENKRINEYEKEYT